MIQRRKKITKKGDVFSLLGKTIYKKVLIRHGDLTEKEKRLLRCLLIPGARLYPGKHYAAGKDEKSLRKSNYTRVPL